MSDSESEATENLEYVVDIQPYLYEPRKRKHELEMCSDSDSESASASSSGESDHAALDSSNSSLSEPEVVDNWCQCGNCEVMPTARENKCCHSYLKVRQVMGDEVCVTNCRAFESNCLDPDVLRVSMYEFIYHNGPYGDEEPEHERFRHLAYRRFCFLVWQKLGRGNRRVIPSCAVLAIRKAFPNAENIPYTGFIPAV